MATRREELHHRLVAVRLLEVENGIDLTPWVVLAWRRTLVLGRRATAPI